MRIVILVLFFLLCVSSLPAFDGGAGHCPNGQVLCDSNHCCKP